MRANVCLSLKMTTTDSVHQILHLRKQCLTNIDSNSPVLTNLLEELLQWQEDVIYQLKKFVRKKFDDIKEKYRQIQHEQIRQLDTLYFNCRSNPFNEAKQQAYTQFMQDCRQSSSFIEISLPKSIDFNDYIQFNTSRWNDLQRSLALLNSNNHLDLTTYRWMSNLTIQSNLTPLFATDDRLLIYYDHHTSLASLHLFNLRYYLEHTKVNPMPMKLRIPCHEFQGKIMHMESCAYMKGFLLATGSKLFVLKISHTATDYSVTESFDLVQRNISGILQKFACHPSTSNFVYLLLNTLTVHSLIEIDLSRNSRLRKQVNYPKDDHTTTTTMDLQLSNINDFVFGNDRLIFAVTYQSSRKEDCPSYQIHIRSLDMTLTYRFQLNSTCAPPLRICVVPSDYSSMEESQQEKFLLIYQNRKILSFFDLNFSRMNEEKIQLIDEILLETEPEHIGFAFNDPSILLLRTPFHIAIYQQIDQSLTNHISIGQRSSSFPPISAL